MAVCRFFQQGRCRYGDSCRFEHIYASAQSSNTNTNNPAACSTEQLLNQIIPDATSALKSGQWMLSAFAPFKNKPNMPGLIDISPEELRLFTFEAKLNGTLTEFLNEMGQHYQQAVEIFKAICKPSPAVVRAIEALYRGELPDNPFVTSNNVQTGNVFGGGATNPPSGNIFGGMAQNNTANTGNIFNNTAQNLFQTASNNMFGGSIQNQFGTDNNIFGTNVEANANAFGSPLFSSGFNAPTTGFAQSTTNNSIFGSQNPNINTGSPFGIPQNQAISPNSVFGQSIQPEVSAAALFGAANANIQKPPDNIFNTPNVMNPPSQNIFGAPSVTQPFQTTDVFGSSGATSNSPFYSNPPSNCQLESSEEIYSKLENLKEEDLLAFKSDAFQYGLIPEIAPPASLC